jgi:peptidoglycan LD-endopeptidase CwlK
MGSRKIDQLVPALQEKAKQFAVEMAQAGIPFMFTCTFRNQSEQDALYAQGRTKPGKKVTWTTKSKHTEGKAFDIAILKDGKPTWDLKTSVNGNDEGDYFEAAMIGHKLGLDCGALWKTPDFPHYQLKEG